MNKYNIGQKVVCIWGTMKGEHFVISAILWNGDYSCLHSNGKYYQYGDRNIELA